MHVLHDDPTTLPSLEAPTAPSAGRLSRAAAARDWFLVRGRGVSPGSATGAVRLIAEPDDRHRLQPEEVLAAHVASPDWVPTMLRAAALVTWDAGPRGEAAIIARELEVPCVVLPRAARGTLQDGGVATVDGTRGLVFGGRIVAGGVDR